MDDTKTCFRALVDAFLHLLSDAIRFFNRRSALDLNMQSSVDNIRPDIFRSQAMNAQHTWN